MKYFLDTEFIEGFHKPLFGKKRHFIDLISIGIMCEDGRQYYAISNEFNVGDASDWVKQNVILPIQMENVPDYIRIRTHTKKLLRFNIENSKSNKQIAKEIIEFVMHPAEFYGYYSDYDWVLFCSLFGRMIDLPKGFPMYCIDLKQMLDERAAAITQLEFTAMLVSGGIDWKVVKEIPKKVINIDDFSVNAKIELLKVQPGYPKQTNEHNALADAQWNYALYKYLNQ